MAELHTERHLLRLHGLGYWHPLAVTTLTLETCATASILRQMAGLDKRQACVKMECRLDLSAIIFSSYLILLEISIRFPHLLDHQASSILQAARLILLLLCY